MGVRRLFTEHPASVGESYLQHLWIASGFALRMFGGAVACFLHALFPFAFRHTGSDCIAGLYAQMNTRRRSATPGSASLPRPSAAR
jgi:Family of unknown function (DUF6356)